MYMYERRKDIDQTDDAMKGRSSRSKDVFEELFHSNIRDITGYVARRVPTDGVDEVVAQVFTTAWRRFADVPPPPESQLWLFGVARRSVLDFRRSEDRAVRLRSKLIQLPI